MILDTLLKSYNEEAWNDYVQACRIMDPAVKAHLGQIEVPGDLAIVLNYNLGEHDAEKWLFRKVPALDNIEPYGLLQTERGMMILKAALMRFP